MKILSTRIIPIIGTLSLLTAASGKAQEFFRDFGNSRSSSGIGRLAPGADVFIGNDPNGITPLTDADVQPTDGQYNMKLGIFELSVALGVGFEFNDNITLSQRNRISDIIFRPELDLEGVIRFSETNRLKLGIGISYAKYLNHSEFDSDSVLISPTSAISWTAEAGAFKFTVRERFSYQEDPFEQPTLSNVANFRRYENQAGIQVDWDASQYTKISVGYDRYDLWAKDDFYKSQDHGINTIFLRPSYQINPSFTVGLNASVSLIDYRQDTHADGTSYLFGPFVKWRVSDYTDVLVEVGYQRSTFDGSTIVPLRDPVTGLPSGTTALDNQNSDSVYAKVEIANRPTDFLRQKLSFSKTSELGFRSNFYDLYHVEYTVDWAMTERTSVRPTLFYEYYEASGPEREKAHRVGGALGIYHVFSDNFTVGLDYRFIVKDSNLNDADYYQNLGLISLYYKF